MIEHGTSEQLGHYRKRKKQNAPSGLDSQFRFKSVILSIPVSSQRMECNKEEATRAKVIAEKKMESKDFVGARKIATKAQRLYPELENIGQIICVCDVHCSAENKKLGNEKDWYSILQVEQSADDVMIKKQYRKFALLLHPDKNKFPGAEAAFKLIGEAQRVLLDREKRSFYDSKYKRFSHYMAPNNPPQPNKNPNVVRQTWGQTSMNNTSSHAKFPPKYEAYSKVSNGWETFLTSCPSCSFQSSYYKDGSKLIQCQLCKKLFTPGDMNAQWRPPGGNSNQTATYTRVDISNQGVRITASNGRYQGNFGPPMPGADPFATSGQSKEVGGSKKVNDNINACKMNTGSSAGANPARKDTGKRGKKRVIEEESSDSFDSESSADYEDAEVEKKRDVNCNQRRSSRAKRHVSYNENGSDDDEIFNSEVPLKNEGMDTKPVSSAEDTNNANGNDSVVKDKVQINGDAENGYESDDSDSILADDSPKILEVPDPEFTDFDKLRKETPFKCGQLWAIYDDQDAMPRFYAEIKRVFSSGNKVRINWLEADPEEGNALLWVEKKLPYSCGKFSYGAADTTEDLLMFSHLMLPKLSKSDAIKIYPKNHQTWALFRRWCTDWISNPETQVKHEYDFVEVLSEYDETVGIRVVFLTKLKGFTCVFCRKGDELQIQPNELLRFSHRVPSSMIVGKETEGVPNGSFELDPASVPISLLNK
ncbi:hypothetical protein V2J09_013427 [Rumex salicifolius]